ncbi:MAG: glycosyltransferase [Roseivirga sp.]|jgi:glycosyltransferase involved in cell wall biosynthesis|uniref:glycosyltransferase n=1 Tax=Roseivirga sp. TaxID=1964215 RepID=UPI001B2D3F8B|nr:glycosyltransferase [Roseivirga sp.]MBO6497480.1 glycosyltransferase [Roseivirga sp.]
MHFYSVVVPVYNRPQEVAELLESLTQQTFTNFEVLIIEDGSTNKCLEVVNTYRSKLNLQYFFKENSGQGFTRNYGFAKAKGDYIVVFDSDCIIPKDYFKEVDSFLESNKVDAFGGPDKAHPDFNDLQKAISYSMTSPLTTGGIRGNKKHVGKFHPRSFNMGISKEVFEKTQGYKITRMGEDIEFSIRILKEGFSTALIPNAFVYHKRRTSLSQLYKQLHFFGRARINVNRFWPGEVKLVHLLPLFFVLGLLVWLSTLWLYMPLFKVGAALLYLYFTIIFWHSTLKSHNINVGFLSMISSFMQLLGYGMGMIAEVIKPRGNQFFAQK